MAKKKTDIVLGAVGGYTWDKIEVWALSLFKSGFQGIGAVIVYEDNEDVIKRLTQIGFQVIRMPLRGSVFNQRFYDFSEVLASAQDDLRYAVVTDVRDVYFQADPTEWLAKNLKKGKQFVACSEGMIYKDESWGEGNVKAGYPHLAHRVLDKCIYNVGVLAGEARAIADLTLAIGVIAKSSGYQVADQSGYNILLDMEPYRSVAHLCASEEGFAMQAGTFADPSKIERFRPHLLEPEPKIDAEGVKTNGGLLYPIVHQYDRVPEWDYKLRVKLNEKLTASAPGAAAE